jgi:23S rRNA (adenine-N6)-dimethyltransferase
MPVYQKQGRTPPITVSQNFLTSAKTISNLVNRTNINSDDYVIEIGPGKGHLTNFLLRRCRLVTAVELDAGLYRKLNEKFLSASNLQLRHMDFLKYTLPSSGKYKVFSNIPFNRTTDIVRKLTESRNPPEEAWLLMEKGAAKRFMGKPRESLRSLMLKPFFDMEVLYYLQREDFHPMPAVDTVLLHFIKKQQPDIRVDRRQAYERFVSEGLKNNGTGLRRLFTHGMYAKALRAAGLQNDSTPANMLYVQWLCLFRCWLDKNP